MGCDATRSRSTGCLRLGAGISGLGERDHRGMAAWAEPSGRPIHAASLSIVLNLAEKVGKHSKLSCRRVAAPRRGGVSACSKVVGLRGARQRGYGGRVEGTAVRRHERPRRPSLGSESRGTVCQSRRRLAQRRRAAARHRSVGGAVWRRPDRPLRPVPRVTFVTSAGASCHFIRKNGLAVGPL